MASFLQLRRTLRSKLRFKKQERPKHEWYELRNQAGDVIVAAPVSREPDGKDVSSGILSLIATQICLSNRELRQAISCPLTRKDYYRILREKGFAI